MQRVGVLAAPAAQLGGVGGEESGGAVSMRGMLSQKAGGGQAAFAGTSRPPPSSKVTAGRDWR